MLPLYGKVLGDYLLNVQNSLDSSIMNHNTTVCEAFVAIFGVITREMSFSLVSDAIHTSNGAYAACLLVIR